MAQSSGGPDILKFALIAAGAYLLYQHTSLSTMFGGTPAPAPAPGAVPPATTPPVAPPDQPTPATAPPPATDREAIARLAATGNQAGVAQAEAAGILYNSDQWNWFRAAGGGGPTTTDLFPPGDRGYVMGIREYLSRRSAAGLSGMRGGWRVSR